MTRPDSIANIVPAGDDWLGQRLADLQRQINELRTAVPNAMVSRDFDGDLDPPTAGTRGWALTQAGDAIVNQLLVGGDSELDGNLQSGNYAPGSAGYRLRSDGNAEFNALTLRNGIIGDDALENPARFANTFSDVNSVNFSVAGSDLAVVHFTVPAGFTRAQVLCFATVGNSRNLGAGAQPYYMQAWIGSSSSAVIATTAEDGSGVSISTAWTAALSGLSAGGTVQAGAWAAVDTTAGWAAGGGNAHVVASATFLR